MTDKEYIEWFKKSPKEAFGMIIKDHQEPIYGFIRKMVLSHEDTDDVLQNTFMKAWKGFKNFKGNSTISTWLHAIARNECYTFLKKKNGKVNYDSEQVEILLNQEHANGYFSGDNTLIYLHKAIETLPPKQKEVFILRYFQEMPYEEIVSTIGGSIGSHKASYHHAAKKIENSVLNSLNLTIDTQSK